MFAVYDGHGGMNYFCYSDFDAGTNTAMFAMYDGHGGMNYFCYSQIRPCLLCMMVTEV